MFRSASLCLFICLSLFCQAQPKLSSGTFSGIKLRNVGPALMSGRIADIVKDPSDRSTWYVATASGNVWKTTNNATTWQPIFEKYGSYTTGAIAIDTQNPGVLWLGTGENASQRSAGYGDGVYRSADAGKTWVNVGLTESEHIGKILIDPRNSQVVYVASQGPLWAPGGDRGVFKTSNGGKTWDKVLDISEHTGVTDIVFDPGNPDVIYAASYQRRRHVGILVAGGPESAVYKSENAGQTWKKLTSGLPKGDVGRIALAVSPQKHNVVYALIAAEEGHSGFFKSTDRGESWEKQSDYVVVDPQYYGEIYADPHQFDRVYCMDVLINVTEDGGKTFSRQNTRHKHVDNHGIWFDPDDPDYLMVGCDGGIYESWDRGSSWKFVNNLPITQFYRVGLDNAEPFYNIYGGTQDNATQGGPSRTNTIHGIRNSDWFITIGGDGFQVRVDPEDPNILYTMYQYAGIARYDKRSAELIDIQPQLPMGEAPLRWHWDAPLIISPHNPHRLYFAAQRLFRSDDRGNSWQTVSADLSRNLDRNQIKVMGRTWGPEAVWKNVFTSPLSTIVSLSESPLQEGLIAVGTDDGLIQVTENGGETWRKITTFSSKVMGIYVSDVLFSQHEVNTIYALFNNHKNGDFKPYVQKSTDLGRSWQSLTNGLPEKHITWSIVEDHVNPDLLFLGTELGLFFTIDGGGQWIQLKSGVPTVAFRDLEIQKRENDLVGASFGRGFFVLDDYSPLRHTSESTLARDAQLFPIKDAWQYVQTRKLSGTKGSMGDSYYAAPNPDFGAVMTYYLKDKLLSRSEQRKIDERIAIEEGKDINYPSWEELRAEDREEPPAVYLTITDDEGNVVRRLEGPVSRGYHRVAWDLKYPSPINGGNSSGPMVIPGNYHASLSKYVDGTWTEIGESQSFTVKSLGLATLEASDKEAVLEFQHKAGQLQRAVIASNTYLREKLSDLEDIKRAVLNSASDGTLLEQVRQLELKLLDYRRSLLGDVTRSKRAEFIAPGILSRIQRVVRGQLHSAMPTKTQQQNYEFAVQAFGDLHRNLSVLDQEEWPRLLKNLENAKIGWTRGMGLPSWKESGK